MSAVTARRDRTVSTALSLVAGLLLAGPAAGAQTPATSAPSAAQVTFSKDVAPILQKRCQNCHRPDSIAPMSLLSYEDARPWARSIKQKVADRDMPPWYVDRNVGIRKFDPDNGLSDQEIATIVKWVDGGVQKGNPADMPPPRVFESADRWAIGKPDIIVKIPKDVVVKAAQPDQWVDLPMEELGLTEDRYIKAVEIKPLKGVKVTHHADALMANEEGDVTGFLVEYAVGKGGDMFPEGTGRLLKKGTKLVMNVHLHAIGEEQPMNVSVGLKLYPADYTPKHVEITQHIGDNEDFDIPAGDSNARADGYTLLSKPTRFTSFQPHLHNRGKAQCVEAIYPADAQMFLPKSKTETLSCVNRYKFAWHIVYHYAEDAQPILPAGTILHVISWFDNSSANKFNPDPTNWVGFGQRSIDDMSFAWMSFYYMTDEEYKQAVEERRAKLGRSQSQQQ